MECKILLRLHDYFRLLSVNITEYARLRIIITITHILISYLCYYNNLGIYNKISYIHQINYKNKQLQKYKQNYKYIRQQRMSQNCIQYSDYKKIIEQQTLSPRKNIFQQNRILNQQITQLTSTNKLLNNKIQYFRNICLSIIDAIGRVFSKQLAKQLEDIMEGFDQEGQGNNMSQTIYEALATHQQQLTVSDWSQSRRSQLRTPEKLQDQYSYQLKSYKQQSFRNSSPFLKQKKRSLSRSPISSSILSNSLKGNDPSTSRSYTPSIIATGINCELCQQTFGPNQFIQHASRCRQSQTSSRKQYESVSNPSLNTQQQSEISLGMSELKQMDLQDTQDRRLKKQSEDYMKMMKNLIMIQGQIQQQIQMLKYSKQKIDRDTQKRKLQKDLAKVMYVIEQKKKEIKDKQKSSMANTKMTKNKKNPTKLRN